MPDIFSTSAEHAFEHPELEFVPEAGTSSMGDALANASVEEAFEVEDTIERILAGGYKTVSCRCAVSDGAMTYGRLACNFLMSCCPTLSLSSKPFRSG